MKAQKLKLAIAGGICLAGLICLTDHAEASIAYDQTLSFIAGTGNSTGGWTVATDNGLALSLRAQYNNTTSPLPSDLTPNNGAGTFTFGTGTPSLAVWDFWFDVNPGSTSTTGDFFILTVTSSLGGTTSIPVGIIPDNAHNGTEFQNAEDIGFSFIGYDPSQIATYNFTLTAEDLSSGDTLDSVGMVVNNGVAPVPEPTTVLAGALLLLPFGASTLRILRRNRAA
ncbi:MAG: hypothetical protein ACREFE_07255 [Limisphaerales bacterium]